MDGERISSGAHALASQSPGVLLYALTLAGQLLAGAARALLASITLGIVHLLTGWPIPAGPIVLVVALAPLVVSLLSVICPPLIAPVDGRWWEIASGGRTPE